MTTSHVLLEVGRIAVVVISAAAGTAVVLNFYFAPQTLPIIEGIEVQGCNPVIDPVDPKLVASFLDTLTKYDKRYVFITDFRVPWYMYCGKDGKPSKRRNAQKDKNQKDSNVLSKAKVNDKTGTIDIEFQGLTGYAGVFLNVTTPQNYPFGASICGEACVGAHGVYQVKAQYAEGRGMFELAPAPVIDRIANAHECTLKTMEAGSWWQKLWACR